MAKYCSQVQ